MALRSGLLSESTWALDVLNILLFDDSSVHYFGLIHLPGLLDLLLDHFQKTLRDIFNGSATNTTTTSNNNTTSTNNNSNDQTTTNRKRIKQEKILAALTSPSSSTLSTSTQTNVDLGSVYDAPKPEDRVVLMTIANNYTLSTRKGVPVKIAPAEEDIFVLDSTRTWDIDSSKSHDLHTTHPSDPFTFGYSEIEPQRYIMDCFKAEILNIPFSTRFKSTSNRNGDSNHSSIINNSNYSSCSSVTNRTKLNNKIEQDDDDHEDEMSTEMATTSSFDTTIGGASESTSNDEQTLKNNAKVMLNNSNSSSSSNNKTVNINNSESSIIGEIKKEPMDVTDSDCRQVDMELERISNGPVPPPPSNEIISHIKTANDINANTNDEDDDSTNGTKESKCKIEFDVKSSVIDPAATIKRRRLSDYEDECYTRDEASLYLVTESQDSLARRCVCLSNILRNLTFVPGNEMEFVKSERFLAILGKLLLLFHDHPVRTPKTRNYDREEDADFSDSCSSLQGENEWWWDYLIQIRENMLAVAANISGQMDLSKYDEFITRPILDGLLHWAVCPSAHGQDSFPTCGNNSPLSPQRLALEALCKLCVTDANVDLVIATPPFSRLEKLCAVLTRHLCRNEDQVLREFSVNLLHYLAAADSAMSRTVAMQSPCISYLVAFIEQAEQTALGVANQHGINFLRENPDSMGTSLDMLRRAAGTLLHLARHPDNRPLFMQQEQRLLGLVMSHILDQQVALIISRVLFQVSRGSGPLMTSDVRIPYTTPPKSLAPAIAPPPLPSATASSPTPTKPIALLS